MIRKGGGEKAGHKYQSRKPDGKGGWIYDYGTAQLQTKLDKLGKEGDKLRTQFITAQHGMRNTPMRAQDRSPEQQKTWDASAAASKKAKAKMDANTDAFNEVYYKLQAAKKAAKEGK